MGVGDGDGKMHFSAIIVSAITVLAGTPPHFEKVYKQTYIPEYKVQCNTS